MLKREGSPIFRCYPFLPNNWNNKIVFSEYLVHYLFEIIALIIVDRNKDCTISTQKVSS